MTVDIQDIDFIDPQHLSVFRSSDWGERGFCNACGTLIFWRTKDHTFANINVFSLEQLPEDLDFNLEIYVDNQPAFYSFNNQTKKMTEAEVIAMFSKDQEEKIIIDEYEECLLVGIFDELNQESL